MRKVLSVVLALALALTCMTGVVLAQDDASAVTGAPATTDIYLMVGISDAFAAGAVKQIDANNPDVVPFIDGDYTLVPFRFIAEALGATVEWIGAESKVVLTRGSDKIELVLGSNQMVKNGTAIEIPAPANTYNDRTFVPLRACAEAFGKKVFWDGTLSFIAITDDESIFKQGVTAAAAIVPYAESFVKAKADDILIDGVSIEGFDPNLDSYRVALSPDADPSKMPEVTVKAKDIFVVEISAFTEIPGSAVVTVRLPALLSVTTRYTLEVRMGGEVDITSSPDDGSNPAANTRDGDMTTYFASDGGDGTGEAWIQYDLPAPTAISEVNIAFFKRIPEDVERQAKITVQISEDGVNFTTIYDGLSAMSETITMERFPLPQKTTVRAIKILGHGNTSEAKGRNIWNSIIEVDWK